MGSRTPSTPKPGTQAIRGKKAAPRSLNVRLETGKGKARVVRLGVAVVTDEELRFRTLRTGQDGADFFVHLRYDELASVEVEPGGGALILTAKVGETYVVHLGKHAPAWKEYLKGPPSRLAVFGVTRSSRLALLHLPDEELSEEIEACVPGAGAVADHVTGLELIFVGAEHKADLDRLGAIALRLKRPGGALWVVYPTSSRGLTEAEVAHAGRKAGLLHTGTVELSRKYQALKLIMPA